MGNERNEKVSNKICTVRVISVFEFFLVKMHFVKFYRIWYLTEASIGININVLYKCCLCLCGTLVAPLTLKQEVLASDITFYKFS